MYVYDGQVCHGVCGGDTHVGSEDNSREPFLSFHLYMDLPLAFFYSVVFSIYVLGDICNVSPPGAVGFQY